MGLARVLSVVLPVLVLLGGLPGPVAAQGTRLSVEVVSTGTAFLLAPGGGVIGSAQVHFSATGECSPIQGSFPDACAFDFASLQGSGELNAVWEIGGAQYSFTASIRMASTPNPENRVSGASDIEDQFFIWDLEYEATLTTGSSSSTGAGRGFIWALAPPFGKQCCGFNSRATAVALAGEWTGRGPFAIAAVWYSEPQTATSPDGTSFDVQAADLVRHRVSTSLALQVNIDIKPGSFPNSINPANKGSIPVAIFSTPTFDAPGQVDQSSLTFGRTGSEQSLAFCKGSEDVNQDGLPDLVCHFDTQASGFQPGDSAGILRGRTLEGGVFEGADSVRIIV